MYRKSNKKRIFTIIMVLVLIEVICLIAINLINTTQKNEELTNEKRALEIEKLENTYTYTYFDNIINQFFKCISERNAEAIISILDKDFIEDNSLNVQNVLDYFEDYKMVNEYISKEVYSQKIARTHIYSGEYSCVKGTISEENKKEEDIFFLIKQDYINSTFSISIITEQECENLKKVENISNSLEIDIEENNYNKRNARIDNLNL